MQKNNIYISPKQTLYLKGIAILCILLHNFFHLIVPLKCQNEMSLDENCVVKFISKFSISESINIFFSFFGFYGVYIFIFLSGYGLTKSFVFKNTGGVYHLHLNTLLKYIVCF